MRQLLQARINKNLLLYNLKQNKSLLIIYTILLFAIAPLIIIISYFTYPFVGDKTAILSPTFFVIAVTVILLFITPFVIFNYITTKRSVDVYHSLPIRRSDLFLTLILTSLILVLTPFLINYALIYTLAATLVKGFDSQFYITAFTNLIYIIPTLLAIFAIPIIVICNTGTLIDGLIHTGILTAFPFALFGTLGFFVTSFGFSLVSLDPRILNFMSPLVALIYIFSKQDPGYFSREFITAYWVILFVIAICLSLRIFVSRKSEKSEEPFVNDWYFPIVAGAFTGLTIVLTNLIFKFSGGYTIKAFLDPRSLIFSIFISFVLYAILNFFRYRSVRTFLKTAKQFALILLISLALPITLISTNFMGMTWKVPKAKTVEKIEYSSSNFRYALPILSNVDYLDFNKKYYLTEPESIQEFVDFHNLMNRRLRSQKDYLQGGGTNGLTDIPEIYNSNDHYKPYELTELTFTYYLKNGDTIKRQVYIPYMLLLEIFPLIDNKDFIINSNPIFNSDNVRSLTAIESNLNKQLVIQNNQEFLDGFEKAYFSDIDNITPEDLLYKENDLKYIIGYQTKQQLISKYQEGDSDILYSHFINIDTRFPNTIQYLESFETFSSEVVKVYKGDIDDYSSVFAKYGVATKVEGYFEDSQLLSVDETNQNFANTLQGSHLKDFNNNIVVISLKDMLIAIPIKP